MTPSRDPCRATPSCYALLRAILPAAMKQRCWAGSDDPLMLDYHDREWAVPLHGDRELFAKLVQRGFRFVGPTICYAFMQAVGMVNDHLVKCFRHAEVRRLAAARR